MPRTPHLLTLADESWPRGSDNQELGDIICTLGETLMNESYQCP